MRHGLRVPTPPPSNSSLKTAESAERNPLWLMLPLPARVSVIRSLGRILVRRVADLERREVGHERS